MLELVKKLTLGVAALAAFAVGGAAIADAASSSTQSTTTTTTTRGATAPPCAGPRHGTAAHEDAEKPVTGDAAAKAQAAAEKIVGSGTAGPVTTDLPGTGYETTVTKPDGSKVEVHLDSSFNALPGPGARGGHGPDGGRPHGGPFGPPPAAPSA